MMAAMGLALSAPVSAQEVSYTYEQITPGPYTPILALSSLGVLTFRGPDGPDFSEAITGQLLEIRAGDKPAFNIRNGDTGAAPGKAVNPAADATFVRAAGARLGVKGIVWGNIASATVATKNYVGSTQQCSTSGTSTSCRAVPVNCTLYQGNYTITPSIYRVDDGKILYTKQIQKSSSTDVCGGEVKGSLFASFNVLFGGGKKVVVTPDAIMTAMRLDAAKAVADELRPPKPTKVAVGFKSRFPEFDATGQARLKGAIEFLKSGRPDRACGTFEEMGQGAKTEQLSLLYNLAACYEVNNNPKVALELYQAFDARITAPDKMVNTALKRLQAIH